jgi:phospholipase/carboxylesterase
MRVTLGLVALAACSLTREPAPPILPAPPPAPAPRVAEAPVRLGFVTRVTADADAQARLPMIVAVHGLGDRPEDFITLFAALPFAARVVAVRGITPYGDGFTWFPPGDADREPGAFLAATRAIAADLPALTRRFPTCGAPVITGFSQGGMLAFAVAAHAPGALRAAIPLAGRLPAAALPAAPPTAPLPWVTALHGMSDARIAFDLGDEAVRALRRLGFAATMRPFEGVGHTVSPAMRAVLYDELRRALGTACGG